MKNTTKEVIKNATIGAVIGYGVGYGLTWILNNAPEAIEFIKTEHRRSKTIKKAKLDVDKFETFTDSYKAFEAAAEHTKESFGHTLFNEKIFINSHVVNEDVKTLLLNLISTAQFYLDNIETESDNFRIAYVNYFTEKIAAEKAGFINKEVFEDDDDEFDYDDDFFDDEEETSDETEEADEMTEGEEEPEESLDRKNAFDIPEEGGENEKSPNCFDAFKNEDTTEEK